MRQLVGYTRLEDPRAAELLNELYAKEWRWFRNFFCPVMEPLRTPVEGGRQATHLRCAHHALSAP